MSVFASVISTLDTKVRKKCQRRYMSIRASDEPRLRAAASPDPSPYHPGTSCRDWVQPNTQGMARMLASPPSPPGREAGREPMLRLLSSSAGVADLKYSRRPGVSKKLR